MLIICDFYFLFNRAKISREFDYFLGFKGSVKREEWRVVSGINQ